jgi:hypothetical protein
MSDQPPMNEKLRARMQRGAEPLLEEGETVQYGVVNLTIPAFAYMAFMGLALLPYVIQKSSMAVVTERNVYVLKTNGFSLKARAALLKAPLGSVTASVGGGGFPGRNLVVGDQKLWLAINRKIHGRARAIAAAASGAPGAEAPAIETGEQPAAE